jgi:tetratricopeptide (TPR) repeat protein
MEGALEGPLPPALRARALHVGAAMAYAQGDYPAAEGRYREALRLCRREGNEVVEGHALAGMGLVQMARSEHDGAVSSLEEAIAIFERCGEDYGAAVARVWLGSVLLAWGHGERAQSSFEKALAWVRSAKNPSLTLITLYSLAQSALDREDHAEAGSLLEEARERGRAMDLDQAVAYALSGAGAPEGPRS